MAGSADEPIDWFRNTAPYINAHRRSTFVVMVPGEVAACGQLLRLMQDLALLSSLGVRIVLVFGSRPQIDAELAELDLPCEMHDGLRVTDSAIMQIIRQVVGRQRFELEALLSMGLPNSPMQGARLQVVSGNFLIARPRGVHKGVDFQLTGSVRRINTQAIRSLLDAGSIVMLSALGHSPSGETFNVNAEEVASAAAIALSAEKLILLTETNGIYDLDDRLIRQCTSASVNSTSTAHQAGGRLLRLAADACTSGVDRCHIVSFCDPDALLTELFTVDGGGTLITREQYESARWAVSDDVSAVLALIQPLEQSGVLRTRSRDLLESEIGQFRILERDSRITACAAMYPFLEEGCAEIACIVTHLDYRGDGRAQKLLEDLENEAQHADITRLFVLTTQTEHWFLEQGFATASLQDLPDQRQRMFNLQRNSKVLIKDLKHSP
ncbi:MAG: amino-acid N-acetyltransferase [Pseudomonadota bacterium]